MSTATHGDNRGKLPVHGFVLAGGKSSRMGRDKATLEFCGRPMVEIAVEKLRGFCAQVSIAGNREDLAAYAPVVREERLDAGPAAGIEAGLKACEQPWAMFVPVDVPLVPGELLRRWAEAVAERASAGCGLSFLLAGGDRQPAFCMAARELAEVVSGAVARGERSIANVLYKVDEADRGWLWPVNADRFGVGEDGGEFLNVNTAQELAEAEAWALGKCSSGAG